MGLFEVRMKFSFTKSLLLAIPFLALLGCTAEPDPPGSGVIEDPKVKICWEAGEFGAHHLSGGVDLLIYPDLVVMNGKGETVGRFLVVNGSIGNILGTDGSTLLQNVDLMTLPVEPVNFPAIIVNGPSWYAKDATGGYVIQNDQIGSVTDPITGDLIAQANFANLPFISIHNGADGSLITTFLSDTLAIYNVGDRCTYTPPPPSSSSEEPVFTSSDVGPGPVTEVSSSSISPVTEPSSSSVQPTAKSSSSSTPKSSSSSQKTSGGCPTIKTKGGSSGSGWATRYWDCCKPSCSWNENAGGNPTKQCTNKGRSPNSDWGGGSVCNGGPNMTCISQIPFTVDGCDEYGFAFAAVPASNGGQCGKCFQLTFTGKGKYGDSRNLANIKGKKLIIMVTNVGSDVEQGQFDIMIPGGGVGIFNGCSSMGWGNQGAQYGGLLSNCEEETNYNAAQTKECLQKKCNSVFSNDTEAKNGCLFLANWMSAAGNPMHNYTEVECPQVLKDKY